MAQPSVASIPSLKDTFGQVRGRMEKAVEDFRGELAAMRTGRANVHMLDTVHVDAYGSQMPLNQVGTVHAAEAQLITVQPWDTSLLGAVEKAIRTAGLGLNPMNDGKVIRVPVPALTEERRKEIVKHLHKVLRNTVPRCVISAATVWRRSRKLPKTRKSPRTTSAAPSTRSRSSPTTKSRRWKSWPRPKRRKLCRSERC